ncbi:Cyclic di-GMP phosphodiesterase PdeB [Paraglaciecola mesophila]|uniref:Cyclic di-GMP phosphodiesterase PdeB n=1 Tax=Paraglaciecola mesophila TaxID=197222 RepID=A0A857JPI2_9ALTE|nr:EAL domain-containing protein [Paraglaciecola mesophila]QHJ13298.1 Cyclic di-GMP phosphodiesterase PdeB [Paraglaciecola mesophila]
MRIRSYLALLVCACLLGAYILEQVLAYRFNSVQTLESEHNESLLWQKDLQRIENTTSQFLVSADLVIGSGNTYLIFGAKNMGEYLINELSQMHDHNRFPPLSKKISESKALVVGINNVLDKVLDLPSSDLQQSLAQLLEQYDPVSLLLSRNIQFLTQETNNTIDDEARFLQAEKQRMEEVSWFTRIGFFLAIIALWWWANSRICKPLNGLIYSSHRALSGHDFEATRRAPTEILELSNDFKHLTETLFHQASHDPLTELQNRRAFERNLKQVIHDNKQNYFLCFIDLDYFKTINDTCGHAAGDEILVSVARILKSNVRSNDIVARLGGDEFAILILDCPFEKALQIANNIKENIRNLTYHWEGETFHLSASIGVAPKVKNNSTTDLLNAADVACGLAKSEGRNTVRLYDASQEQVNLKQHDILSVHQINNALKNDQFILYKQDIMPLQNTQVGRYFEVLLRMKGMDGKIISPASFLPIAERYRLTSQIDTWVVSAVFAHFRQNQAQLENTAMIFINLSGHSMNDHELETFIIDKVIKGGIPANKLCFEVTETVAIANIKRAKLFIENIKKLGCCFALDDFGSGHSSYAYLRELPTEKIKIDGTIIANMMDNPLDYTTVKSICEIAKAANQEIIAEFVENEKTVDALTKLGVDFAQGYHFNRPSELR